MAASGSASVALPTDAESSAPPAKEAVRGGGLLRQLLACRRRASQEEAVQQRYRNLVTASRKIPEQRKHWYDKLSWWSDVPTRRGSRIFVLAPRGPQGQQNYKIDMWELVGYSLSKMHDHVVVENKPFAVVWVQQNDHRIWPLDWRRFLAVLEKSYAANLEAIHVVHPSWSIRLLRLALWPIAEDAYWDRFLCHERIEFLDSQIDTRKFRLPKDIGEYDKWLDKQAAELNAQANKKNGRWHVRLRCC